MIACSISFVIHPTDLTWALSMSSFRIWFFGYPKDYDTFLDESLNIKIRKCAAFAYRTAMRKRIFSLFNLQGAMLASSCLDPLIVRHLSQWMRHTISAQS